MSNIWIRETEVLVAGRKIAEPDYRVNFTVNFDPDPDSDTTEIDILNLNHDTISQINKGKPIILNAGYRGDTGTIFSGINLHVYTEIEDNDRVLKIIAYDASDDFLNATVNKGYAKNTKASYIIKDALSKVGLEVGEINLKKDVTYKRGKYLFQLCDLEAVDRNSQDFTPIDDYSVWFANR
jgi:hypothetical protein